MSKKKKLKAINHTRNKTYFGLFLLSQTLALAFAMPLGIGAFTIFCIFWLAMPAILLIYCIVYQIRTGEVHPILRGELDYE